MTDKFNKLKNDSDSDESDSDNKLYSDGYDSDELDSHDRHNMTSYFYKSYKSYIKKLDLKLDEIVIYPVTNKYAMYHKMLGISGFYEYYDTNPDGSMFFVPNHAFIFFCGNGYLAYAKDILHLGDVSLEHCHEPAFIKACNNECFEVAKWLYFLRCVSPYIIERQIYKYVCDHHRSISRGFYQKWLWFSVSKFKQELIMDRLRYNKRHNIAKLLKSLNE